jgi:predicted aspartyl protease
MLAPSSCRRVLGLFLLTLLSRCSPDVTDCHLDMVTRIPLEVQDDLLVVPAGINGKWVRLVVDTGAERTTIAASTAKRLGLPRDARHTTRSLGVGGSSTSSDATIDRLVLGGVHFPLERIAVGNIKLQSDRGLNADGLLGADILLAFDLDIDVPGGQLTLYRARRCPAARLPWQEPGAEITGVKARKDRLLIPFELDGATGLAILDTGAQREVVGVAMARRLDLNGQAMDGDPMVRQHGVGPMAVMTHLHKFKLLRIGPVVQHSPRLAVMETDAGMGDALIGEEFLRGRRVWLSFSNRQVYVSLTPPTPP